MLRLEAIDLDELGGALDHGSPESESSWWINADTGEIRYHCPDVDGDADEVFDSSWRHIEPLEPRVAYRDMEAFASSVHDARAADLLARTLDGRGAFRRFRETLSELPELRREWYAFRDQRMRRRAVEWLVDEGLVLAVVSDEGAVD